MNKQTQYEKLPLESALDETPQILSIVSVYSDDAKYLQEYIETLHQISTQLVSIQNKLTSSYQDLSRHLRSFKPTKFIPESDPGGELATNLKKFADIIAEMSSWQHIFATQLADGVVYPLSKFVGSDLQDINTLRTLYQTESTDVDRAIGRYSRCRRRDPQQERHEASEDIYTSKKNFHLIALQYYSRLNQLQLSRQLALLKPVLGLVTAARGFHQLGHECLNTTQNDDFLSGVGITLKGLVDDVHKDRVETEEFINSIVSQSQLMYYPQPPGELARLPPDTTLSTKSGYLNVHRKYMGVISSWERQFVFMEGGNLLGVPKIEVAGSLLMELDSTTLAHAIDTDDRLHVFTVVTAKRSIILQALNDRDRDEWILIIQKVSKDGSYVRNERQPSSSSLLSGVSQFFADKLHAASSAVGATTPPSSPVIEGSAPPTRILRGDLIPKDVPIVFDILSLAEDIHTEDQDGSNAEASGDLPAKVFSVRFLGCMGVNVDAVDCFIVGQTVVFEVMRRILAARAIHDMFSTSQLLLSVSHSHLILRDPSSKAIRLQHKLKDIAFWASHAENQRLVGYIVRQQEGSKDISFSCYVFESDEGGREICSALGTAARQVYAHLLDKTTKQEIRKGETKLLLDNIAKLPDKDSPPPLSPDGSHLVLESDSSRSDELCPPSRKSKQPESEA